jgi:predicted AlkP superfamily pyrophosphatase or phosphodiesterase
LAGLPGCNRSGTLSDLKPTVILVSLDGFRYDYIEKFAPPTILSLASEGVRAKWMTPSFPTKTFPNHYAIVTGLYPQDNGIVENSIYDQTSKATMTMGNREEVQKGHWWVAEPIWITAEKQGQRSAPFFWPGSEAEIGGMRPTYWKPYDDHLPNDTRVDTILSWLDLPPGERPTFLTLYFSDVDSAGHDLSPDSPKVGEAVLRVDKELARLVEGLKARGVFEQVNIIIVSDHGMATQDFNNVIILDELFDQNLAEKILWSNEIVSIFPRAGKEDVIYGKLRAGLPGHAKVYKKSELPARLHYSDSIRIAPLLVLPDEGWTLAPRKRFEEWRSRGLLNGPRGGHGYDNDLASMRAIFVARGSAFKKGAVIEPFENIHVYSLMTRILGLRPAHNVDNAELATAALF